MPLEPGDLIANRYEIQSSLGEGGMGIVYAAWDQKLSRSVALKVIKDDDSDHEAIRRFVLEWKALVLVEHDNVLKVYDADRDGPRWFFTAELLSGQTLATKLEGRAMHWTDATRVALQLASALQCMHEHRIVHRDVKPQNVFLTAAGNVKLLDFGIVKSFHLTAHDQVQTATGGTLFTAPFASPEQLRGLDVDRRSDIFSFGILLHLMVAGAHPFDYWWPKILNDTPAPMLESAQAPLEFSTLVQRCLQKQRDARFSKMSEVADALHHALAGQTLKELPPTVIATGIEEHVRPISNASQPLHSFRPSAELARRIDALSSELTDRPLVGRSGEVNTLERFVARSSGFLLVTGDAGHGKSALLAHWLAQSATQARIVRHFFSWRSDLTRSVLEFYRSTLVSLSAHWNQPLLRLPASEREARDGLFELFEHVTSAGTRDAAPLLLVLDGIDEAASTEQWDDPFFPSILPDNMHVVASARLGDAEQPPPYLAGWIAQSDSRLRVGPLQRSAVIDWMQRLDGRCTELADNEDAVRTLLQRTNGLPLHLALIFDDLQQLSNRDAFPRFVNQTPTGLAAYVDREFRILAESQIGREQRWREFFGLLVAAKAELQRDDISDILGLTIWDLYALPSELRRWVAQRDSGYAFRNEALRLAFAELDPWPLAQDRLLSYSREWRVHRRPYALRAVIAHLREVNDRVAWLATAADRTFLKYQGAAFPSEPLMPLQTIEEAMREAIARHELSALCGLIFVHASWMPNAREVNPLNFAVTAPAQAWQQIKLAEVTDPSTEVAWQLLVAWRCAVAGNVEEARRFLSQVITPGRHVNVVYWVQILGAVFPTLMDVDFTQALNVAVALIDTAELPRLLGLVCQPAEAITLTREWASNARTSRAGWFALCGSLAEKGELTAAFETLRGLEPERLRANCLAEMAQVSFRLGRLNQLEACLVEIDAFPAETDEGQFAIAKARAVVLASIGATRLRNGDHSGRALLTEAEDVVKAMPPVLPHQPEAMAIVGEAWARAGDAEAAATAFDWSLERLRVSPPIKALQLGTLVDIARQLWEAHHSCPELRERVMDLLARMEESAHGNLSLELENNFPWTIADGWDELGQSTKALKWIRAIRNPQFRGKAVGAMVKRRLRTDDVAAAELIVKHHGGRYAGWGLVHIGKHYVSGKRWNDAARVFALAVQSAATSGGRLHSYHTVLLLTELAFAFDLKGDTQSTSLHLKSAIHQAAAISTQVKWWYRLNIAERSFWFQTTDLGAQLLREATAGVLGAVDDPERVPLLGFLARVQLLVARQAARAEEALARARSIAKSHIPDRVKGMIARCEIAEALHLCGLHDRARDEMAYAARFAESRATHPKDKADEVIAEAALGCARIAELSNARRLLALIEGSRLYSANRAWAIIHTYEGDDALSEAEVSRVANENLRARIRRDLAETLIKLGRVEQALVVARRISVDRDSTLPRIALACVEQGYPGAFFELVVPATRFPNAATWVLAGLVRLHPELAEEVSRLLVKYVPSLLRNS